MYIFITNKYADQIWMDIIASEDFSSSIMSSVQGRSIYLRLNKNMRHLKLDQVFHNTILGPSLAIWVCQIYQFLQKKTEGIFQKTNPLKFQKSYLKFHTLFCLIITIFLLKKSSLQGKKHKEPTCGSLVLFGWLRSTRATQALGRSFRTSRDLGANGFYVSL